MNAVPGHVEEIEEDFGFFDLFRKKEERGSRGGEAGDPDSQPGKKEGEREPAWEIIRKIFKKKEN